MTTSVLLGGCILAMLAPVAVHASEYCEQEFYFAVASAQRNFQDCESSGQYTDQQCHDQYDASYAAAEQDYNDCIGPANCNESFTCYGPMSFTSSPRSFSNRLYNQHEPYQPWYTRKRLYI